MRHDQNHPTWAWTPLGSNSLLEVPAGPGGDLVGAKDQLLCCAAPQSARDARLRMEGWFREIKLLETPFRIFQGKPQCNPAITLHCDTVCESIHWCWRWSIFPASLCHPLAFSMAAEMRLWSSPGVNQVRPLAWPRGISVTLFTWQ